MFVGKDYVQTQLGFEKEFEHLTHPLHLNTTEAQLHLEV